MAFMGADYDAGHIEIELSDEALTLRVPGFTRFNASEFCARNLRLVRLFACAGVSSLGGLGAIRACDESFHISLDAIEIQTAAELKLSASQTQETQLKVLPSRLLNLPILAAR
jgi:hypothetical protein